MDLKCPCGCAGESKYKHFSSPEGKCGFYYVVEITYPSKGLGTTYKTLPNLSESVSTTNSNGDVTEPNNIPNTTEANGSVNTTVPPAFPNNSPTATFSEIPFPPVFPVLSSGNSIPTAASSDSETDETISAAPMPEGGDFKSMIAGAFKNGKPMLKSHSKSSVYTSDPSKLGHTWSTPAQSDNNQSKPPIIPEKPDLQTILLKRQIAFLGEDDEVNDWD